MSNGAIETGKTKVAVEQFAAALAKNIVFVSYAIPSE
jgi:hypothetical protein